MKKLNEKGFAVSTLLYGLMLVAFLIVSLLMSIMSTNRKNTNTLVKKIEEELNRYSQTVTEFTSTDGTQEFIVPYGKAGWYKIELWGAAAQNVQTLPTETTKGRGAYTSGIIYLEENTHLYFQIGSKGGAGGTLNNTSSSNGGGATDVRLEGGNWNSDEGKASRIMIAAGGSHNNSTHRGTGAITGTGFNTYYTFKDSSNNYDGGSYISGYAGQNEHATHKFINTLMISGVNAGAGKAKIELVSTNTAGNPPAKKTNWFTGVRYITNCVKYTTAQTKELWREIVAIDSTGTNVALGKTVRYGNSIEAAKTGSEVTGFTDGSLATVTHSPAKTSGFSKVGGYYTSCVRLDLGGPYNLEEITFFHDNPTNSSSAHANYSADTVYINNSFFREPDPSYVVSETYMGVRISERNPDIADPSTLKTSNYFIQSALSDNRFVTISGGTGQLLLFTGDKNQRWSVTSVGSNQFKILEGDMQMALQPTEGGLEVGEGISTPTTYQEHAWEKWQITDVQLNGYYQLKTLSGQNLCLATRNTSRDTSGLLELKTCNSIDKSQWFRFINADF